MATSNPGFTVMLDPVEADRVRAALVEDVARFTCLPMVREFAVPPMRRRSAEVVCTDGDDPTATDDPSRGEMRQVADAFRIRGAAAGAGAARRPRCAGHGARRRAEDRVLHE